MAQEVNLTDESLKIAHALNERFPEQMLDINEFRGQISVTVRKEKK